MSDLYHDYLYLLMLDGGHPAPAPLDPLEAPRLDAELTAEQAAGMDDVMEALV